MIIKVRVVPNCKNNEIVSRVGSVIRLCVKTKDVDSDETNEIVKRSIAEFFGVKLKDIYLRKGHRGKEKTIEIEGKSDEELKELMDCIP
ncbi:MAG: DUF167 domain-containing protein [Elusimicrobiota bacterium]|nr:DUF167 domain-containing protein [Endomicrobiia bacterium]MCX7910368.1 DUF167 domain-containing protein [Endomicrobiia bacterium]MDW8165565.1 DUF167 domain-containing protein [Elusimicrobiota bacterium]